MQKMSDAQRRKIFKLKNEHGLDEETFRSMLQTTVNKESLKLLTIRDAVDVINRLEGKPQRVNRISHKQESYIKGLAKNLGWVDIDGNLDMTKLNRWLEGRYHVSSLSWLTPKNASDAIEGLKVMTARQAEDMNLAI